MSEQPEIEISKLPSDVRTRLAKLELELSEGDITQKGYDKKRQLLLAPYIQSQKNGGPKTAAAASPTTRAHRKQQRRLTRNESRYHSEIRQEAVQQALAEWKIDSKTPAKLPVQPLKRRTLQKRANKAELSGSSDCVIVNWQRQPARPFIHLLFLLSNPWMGVLLRGSGFFRGSFCHFRNCRHFHSLLLPVYYHSSLLN
uniref:DMAP1-binding domain-containing protein n=1 Tax=Acrobeloides nanus TaxID=290746 RepID=A0A914CNT1_9BILA